MKTKTRQAQTDVPLQSALSESTLRLVQGGSQTSQEEQIEEAGVFAGPITNPLG